MFLRKNSVYSKLLWYNYPYDIIVGDSMYDEVGRIIKLDDNKEYLLIGRIDDDLDTYVYLMSVSGPLNVIIAMEKEHNRSLVELVPVLEESERKRIYNLFLQKARLGLL